MKIKKNYSQEEAAGAGSEKKGFFGADVPEKFDVVFGDGDDTTDDNPGGDDPNGDDPNGNNGGGEDPNGKGKKSEGEGDDDETPAGEAVKPKAKAEEGKEGEEGKEAAAGDDDVLPLLDEAAGAEPETSWDDLSAVFELPEIEDKNLQGQDKFKAQIEAVKKAEREAGRAEAESVELQRFAPEAQVLVKALNQGMKMEEILKPAAGYYQAIASSDEELVLDYHRTVLKQADEVAADQVSALDANGTLKTEADKIRAVLASQADVIVNGQIKKYADQYEAEQERIKKDTDRENQLVASEIRSRQEFIGGKITKEVQDNLVKRWEAGHYKNLMKNSPKDVVEFILWKEYGQSRAAKMKGNIEKEVKKEAFKVLANTPNSNGGAAVSSGDGSKKGFAAWGEATPSGVEFG